MITGVEVGAALLAAVGQALGRQVRYRGRTAIGESGAAFLLDDDLVLKVLSDGDGVRAEQQRIAGLVEGLRHRGYPVPRHLAVGSADGVVFTVQERLPGRPVEPHDLPLVLPQVLDAVELQQDAGDGDGPAWPDRILETIERGGDGYCLHSTMRASPDTAALLSRLQTIAADGASGPVRRTDIVHFDLNAANLLHVEDDLTGIVDWTAAASGDRGFDVATLLFYAYDVDTVRGVLEDRAVAISGRRWTTVYLCHLVLRSVEWSRRHRPGSAEDRRFVALAARVLDDHA